MNTTDSYWHIDYSFEWRLTPELMDIKIRSFIFSIIGVFAGLPALVWSVGELIEHRRNGHRISVFIILLLLTDFTELYLSPYILMKDLLNELMRNMDWTCWVFQSLWWSSTDCGVLLNQLVALEGILSVKYPLYTAAAFSSRWFKVFYTLVLLSLIICDFFWFYLSMTKIYRYAFSLSILLVSVITWIISCGASCSAERHSHTSRKADPHIVVIFIFNLLMLFFCVITSPSGYTADLSHIPWLLVRLRLISDPLLCVLVCRQNLSVQTTQNPEETSVQPE